MCLLLVDCRGLALRRDSRAATRSRAGPEALRGRISADVPAGHIIVALGGASRPGWRVGAGLRQGHRHTTSRTCCPALGKRLGRPEGRPGQLAAAPQRDGLLRTAWDRTWGVQGCVPDVRGHAGQGCDGKRDRDGEGRRDPGIEAGAEGRGSSGRDPGAVRGIRGRARRDCGRGVLQGGQSHGSWGGLSDSLVDSGNDCGGNHRGNAGGGDEPGRPSGYGSGG